MFNPNLPLSKDISFGLAGIDTQEALRFSTIITTCEEDKQFEVLYQYLKEYSDIQNFPNSRFNEELLPSFRKNSSDYSRYTLYPVTGFHCDSKLLPYNKFAYDTKYGFIISDKNNIHNSAILGFTFIDESTVLNPEFYGRRYSEFSIKNGDLYIQQLQGPTYRKKRRDILKNIMWPHLLTSVAIDFSRYIGVPRVLFQPHEYNKWPLIYDNVSNRGLLRYDTTAERMGFSRPNKNAPYVWNNFYNIRT